MATDRSVARTLAFLHELYPTRDITPATVEAWSACFREWPDQLLQECAAKCAKEQGRTFFPTPGEVMLHHPKTHIDVDALKRRIEKLGHYSPHTGWVLPSVEVVRAALGDGIADAYAGVGTALFSENETTASIAEREFRGNLAATPEPQGRLYGTPVTKYLTEGG